MQKYLIKDISIVNEGRIRVADILMADERIEKIENNINVREKVTELDGSGKHLFPGIIDDQVHFREPGLTHKADLYTESRAAVAGGVTSFMEMPNTVPNALTLELLEDKYRRAAQVSLGNYSFYMGTSNDNAEEVLKVNAHKESICGVKIFMGSSTGNMLVEREETLRKVFGGSEMLIACHCEREDIINRNLQKKLAEGVPLQPGDHPIIRDTEACYASSSFAVELAKQYGSRLHVLHITTAKELELFTNEIPLPKKKITSEVCVHHLHFTADDYASLGYLIKCNPAIKSPENKEALWKGLLDDHLDVIATDHAPHLLSEKGPLYENAHAGLPLVQHSLSLMLHYHKEGRISLEKIAEKMCHAVADCFHVRDRGYIREGYFADLAMVDLRQEQMVSKSNIYYKCGWSPLENRTLSGKVSHTFVNGNLVYENGAFHEQHKGKRLTFDPR
jgi:dihydroorotase